VFKLYLRITVNVFKYDQVCSSVSILSLCLLIFGDSRLHYSLGFCYARFSLAPYQPCISKVCGDYVVTLVNWTPIIEWFIIEWVITEFFVLSSSVRHSFIFCGECQEVESEAYVVSLFYGSGVRIRATKAF
jgi:hypothetical protein